MVSEVAYSAIRDNELSDLKAYIGKNADAYIVFYESVHLGRKLRFCVVWTAMFVPLVWILYRKMYLFFIIACVLLIALWVVGIEKSGSSTGVAIAASGKWFYLARAKRDVQKIQKLGLSDEDRLRLLAKKGGVSYVGAVIGVLVTSGWIALALLASR